MPDWTSEYVTLIEDCQRRSDRMTDWERVFIDSLEGSIINGKRPTENQENCLNKIWEKVTEKG